MTADFRDWPLPPAPDPRRMWRLINWEHTMTDG